MDIQMPIMNGYEAAQAIRKLENKKLAEIPIIAMTANAFSEDIQRAKAAGMNSHIAKPIDVQKMIEVLAEVLK
jgi:CheY-like chemotaxis protein